MLLLPAACGVARPRPTSRAGAVLTVNFRQTSYDFTFGVAMNFISYPLVSAKTFVAKLVFY
jgi:hypothetical protein